MTAIVLEWIDKRESFGLLQGKFGAERTHYCKYQPAQLKLFLVSHTTYCMSTKIVPQYLYFHLKNCRRHTDIAVASFSQTQTAEGSRQTSEKFPERGWPIIYQRQSRGNQALVHSIHIH